MDDSHNRVRAHYDALRPRYAAIRSTGLMRLFKQREIASVLELLAPVAGETALDAGCGPGIYARLLSARGLHVTAIDLSPRMIDEVRAMVGDVEELSLDRTFDCVLCLGLLR